MGKMEKPNGKQPPAGWTKKKPQNWYGNVFRGSFQSFLSIFRPFLDHFALSSWGLFSVWFSIFPYLVPLAACLAAFLSHDPKACGVVGSDFWATPPRVISSSLEELQGQRSQT